MLKEKGFIPIIIFIVILVIIVSILIYKPTFLKNYLSDQSLQSQSRDLDDVNEDELSMYKIPSDVLNAISEAKSAGNPVLGIRADGPTYHMPILMYHYIEHVKDAGDKIRISLNILPETLDKQIQTLADAGYTFITASDLADILDGIKPIPPKPIMLTFDDGYRDFYTGAFPILKKYNVKSVAYIISGFINKPNNLTDSQLEEIAKSGLVEIGAHTVHHLALKGLSDQTAKDEIINSKIQLEQKLGIPITAFAYPYGSFDINTIQFVKEAGFRTAVSTIPGAEVSNQVRFLTYRIRPGANTGKALLNLVQK